MIAQSIHRIAFRVGVIFLVSFAINYVWEMLQMPFFEAMSFAEPSSYLRCLAASLGDAAIAAAIFLLGRLIFHAWKWPHRLTPIKALYLILIGAGIAIAIEIAALNAGRWAYSPLMPLIPMFRVGLVPVVQLMLLPYVSFIILRRRLYRD